MKKEIESIVFINRYLANHKDDSERTELVRGYLTSKVSSMLESKVNPNKDLISKVCNLPLSLLSF